MSFVVKIEELGHRAAFLKSMFAGPLEGAECFRRLGEAERAARRFESENPGAWCRVVRG